MKELKNILAIIGSASNNSSNLKLVEQMAMLAAESLNITIYDSLKSLPHFDPELSINNPPTTVIDFRKKIEQADGIIICTPEYVFSIPSGLKNAIEWCIATTIFDGKPSCLITASASGLKGQESLELIMKTAMAKFSKDTCLLIQGIKSKLDNDGNFTDEKTKAKVEHLLAAFVDLMNKK